MQAFTGIAQRVLVGAFRQAEALHAHAEAGRVHHHEHRLQAFVRLAQQIAFGTIEIHHAGGGTMNAHLVFDRATAHGIARAHAAIAGYLEFGHHK